MTKDKTREGSVSSPTSPPPPPNIGADAAAYKEKLYRSKKPPVEGKKRKKKTQGGDVESDEDGHVLPASSTQDDEDIIAREKIILQQGEEFKNTGKADELAQLIKNTRPFLERVSKAKAAKLVRALVEMFLDMDAGTGYEIELCKECIEWASEEKRVFLRQSLEARLMQLYHDNKMYTEALALGSKLLKELKKLEDKNLLLEVQLCESKTYRALGNLGKARASLTSAKTTASGIYCPPRLQAALDLQSGILHAAQDRDFKTAYSYFFESFEGYDSIDDTRMALTALKYMILSKVMLKLHSDIPSIVSGKMALRYAGDELEAMKKIAVASQNRSLCEFQQALKTYQKELEIDPIIRSHLGTLYDQMLEQNLLKIIEPYSKVEIEFIASNIGLPVRAVEKKLSQMILDGAFSAILDQGAGILTVFDESPRDKAYDTVLDTFRDLEKVVDMLFLETKSLASSDREARNKSTRAKA